MSLDLEAGEVHALIGENGAGKSTLMKILSGAYRPDAGTMTLDGRATPARSAGRHGSRGVAMIYQELTMAPHLTVEANVMLGQERVRAGLVRRHVHRKLVAEALELLEHPEIRSDAIAGTLSVAAQQLVEVARAAGVECPGHRLRRADQLAHRARRRAAVRGDRPAPSPGLAIVYISHFLEEVRRSPGDIRCCATVDGGLGDRLAGTVLTAIIAAMVGRDLNELFPRAAQAGGTGAGADGSGRKSAPVRRPDASIGVRSWASPAWWERGERSSSAIFGLDPVRYGAIVVKGMSGIHAEPAAADRAGARAS